MPTLLVIDDDPDILLPYIVHACDGVFCGVEVALTGGDGLEMAARLQPSVILLDIYLPEINGLEVLVQLRRTNPHCPIIIITGASSTATAIEAVKRGAYEYLIKPPDLSELTLSLTRALDVSRQMNVPTVIANQEPANEGADVIVGMSRAMRDVYKSIGQVAERDVTVLILGESGTGKELVARAIYQYSRRSQGLFLAVNCAAIPESLLESEFFGHEQGAFTGAARRRIGKFEQCSGGTLFLDEIGDLSPGTQGKLLRLLQEQQFERVGGNETVHTDVRLVAATSRDLEAMVREGLFRIDLYYRLNVCEIQLPPLRERPGDLVQLVQHFIRRYCKELNKPTHTLVPEVVDLLRRYSWPGNVRELQNVIRQMLLRSTSDVLIPAHLPEHIRSTALSVRTVHAEPAGDASNVPLTYLETFIRERLAGNTTALASEVENLVDRVLLPEVLAHTGGNQLKAALLLGVSRRKLRNRLRELGLKIEHTMGSDSDSDYLLELPPAGNPSAKD